MSHESYLNPIEVKVENLGKLINASKRKFTWAFDFDSKKHEFSLVLSVVSNKYKIFYDNSEVDKGSMPFFHPFEYRINIDDLEFFIEQQKNNMKLAVNDQLFAKGSKIHIWNPKNLKMEKSKSVAKILTKESQLDIPTDRRVTENQLNTKLPPKPYQLPPQKNFQKQPTNKPPENLFYKNDFFSDNNKNDFEPPLIENGSTGKRGIRWNGIDPFETKSDIFFKMKFNQETQLERDLIEKLYLKR